MKTLRTFTNKLSERIGRLSKEDYQLVLYSLCFMISFTLDSIHCKLLAYYYGCSVDQLLSYDRSGLLLILSMAFGIVDFFFAYKVFKLVYKSAMKIEITLINGVWLRSIKATGLKKLLQPVAIFVMGLSTLSILYDFYRIFVHVFK